MEEAHAQAAFKIAVFVQMVLLAPLALLVLTIMELTVSTVQAQHQDL